eukprot:CAMPEP_0197453706 /NCGR_PEP_ID=MMETSP1175-20131217/35767_1 /TAXON_ID=1003142 /ORGANISM="Triceratium dubium, Strain CCMP147" /LENGTH=36 /DNA_ID= /DNA_START= /DNA_END= /DNA_ORIENTATION=
MSTSTTYFTLASLWHAAATVASQAGIESMPFPGDAP